MVDFLRKNKIEEKFIDNYNADGNRFSFDEYLKYGKPEFFIGGAFRFEATPEGFDFWSKVEKKFLRELKKLNNG